MTNAYAVRHASLQKGTCVSKCLLLKKDCYFNKMRGIVKFRNVYSHLFGGQDAALEELLEQIVYTLRGLNRCDHQKIRVYLRNSGTLR